MVTFQTNLRKLNPTDILKNIHDGEFIILFEKGTEEEKTRLELLSYNLKNLRTDFLEIDLLSSFYTHGHLNRIIQTTQNNV